VEICFLENDGKLCLIMDKQRTEDIYVHLGELQKLKNG
jgi:nitrate reductase NapAB chaperone NapD